MSTRIALFAASLLATLSVGAAQSGRTPASVDPVSFILDGFQTHQVVALGETHGRQDLHNIYERILRHPEFPTRAGIVLLEYGNARYQSLIDTYTEGGPVTLDELRVVWRDMVESPMVQYGVDEFEHLFVAVREVNQMVPAARHIRILAGGPPIDWSTIQTSADYAAFQSRYPKEQHTAHVLIDQVLRPNKRALVISGSAHLKKTSTLARVVARDAPEFAQSVLYVFAMAGFGSRSEEIQSRLGRFTTPAVLPLAGTWLADIDKPSVTTDANVWLTDVTDGSVQEDDLIVEHGPGGGKVVMQVKGGNRVLVAKESSAASAGNQMLGAPAPPSAAAPGNQTLSSGGPSPLLLDVGVWRRVTEDAGRTLFDIADALLVTSPTPTIVADALWSDDGFWTTLDRRVRLLTGQPLDPRIRSSKGAFDRHGGG